MVWVVSSLNNKQQTDSFNQTQRGEKKLTVENRKVFINSCIIVYYLKLERKNCDEMMSRYLKNTGTKFFKFFLTN